MDKLNLINLNYNDVCCLLDCVRASIDLAKNGKSILTLPCDDIKQEIEILKEYENTLDNYIINTEWD